MVLDIDKLQAAVDGLETASAPSEFTKYLTALEQEGTERAATTAANPSDTTTSATSESWAAGINDVFTAARKDLIGAGWNASSMKPAT